MKLSIANLRAAGVTDEQILKVVEEAQAEQREKNRIRQRNHRARNASHNRHSDKAITEQKQQPCHSDMRDALSPLIPPSKNSEGSKKNLPRSSRATSKTPIADDWQLTDADWRYAHDKGWGDKRIAEEAERFKQRNRKTGDRYANWHAAWCSWVMSPYQKPNGGKPQSLKDRNREIMDELDRFIESEAARACARRDDHAQGHFLLPFDQPGRAEGVPRRAGDVVVEVPGGGGEPRGVAGDASEPDVPTDNPTRRTALR